MDPATAAIEETRNTAERAMYYTQRMPRLLNWQVELLTYSLQTTADAKAVVDHAFARALIVVVALVLGGLLAGILFRVATRRVNEPATPVRTDSF